MSEPRVRLLRGSRKGEAAFDWWSLVHLAGGLILGLAPIGWLWGIGLVLGYEVVEAGLRRVKTEEGGLFEYESWTNIGADVVIGLLGFGITHATVGPLLPWPWSL